MRLPPALFARSGDELVLEPAAIPALDRFWALKDRMYGEVINLPSNIVCEAELSRWIAERYEPTLLRGLREACKLQPGVSPLLATLRGAGVRLGLVSDYRGVSDRLAALGLAPANFDFVLVLSLIHISEPTRPY